MIKHLFLVRHGDTKYATNDNTNVRTDLGLTELGIKQAELTGKRLALWLKGADYGFYSSDLPGAKATAEGIGLILAKQYTAVQELRDPHISDKLEAPPPEPVKTNPWQMTGPLINWVDETAIDKKEEPAACGGKITDFMRMIQNIEKESVVAVSHEDQIISIILWWLELTEKQAEKMSFDIDPGSITLLRINSKGLRTIAKLNDTGHLTAGEK
ncbi:MAG: histidine phosphatase family protein [Bacillota bacterium]